MPFTLRVLLRLVRRPAQTAERLIRLLATRVVNEAVAFQRAIEGFVGGQQPLKQGRGELLAFQEPRAVKMPRGAS